MPFGQPGAYWLLLGAGIERRRSRYDVELAAQVIGGTQYPGAREFAARHVVQPPAERERLAVFGGAERS
jgi:hypothetical protein